MEEVVKVIDPFAKSGFSEKTQKEWSMAYVELSNGEKARIFNPIAVGDKVESVQNGEYKNWVKVRPPKVDGNEVMEALKRIESKLDKLLGEDEKEPAETDPSMPEDWLED